MKNLLYLLWGVAISLPLFSQSSVILLANSSFEDAPWWSKPPEGWYVCGQPGESPPDVHPLGAFGVTTPAADGRSYVGMVTRDNQTWEGIGQTLSSPLIAGQCYRFSIYAARSDRYSSLSRLTNTPKEYTDPVVLRIWGGRQNCAQTELLARTTAIDHEDWQCYTFFLTPKEGYTHLLLEAYYTGPVPYCGNILIDQASPLVPVDSLTGQPVVSADTTSWKTSEKMPVDKVASAIRFDGTELAKWLFSGRQQEWVWGNPYFYMLVEKLKTDPELRLILRVSANSGKMANRQKKLLGKELDSFGFSKKRVVCRKKKTSGTSGEITVEQRFR